MQSREEEQDISILLVQVAVEVDGTGAGLGSDHSLIVAGAGAVLVAHSCSGNLEAVPRHSAQSVCIQFPPTTL